MSLLIMSLLRNVVPWIAIAVALPGLSACVYEAPITMRPTRGVDSHLVGDWVSADGKEQVKIRDLDRKTYVIEYDGDLFRAWHSDVDGLALVSVQDLQRPERRFAYIAYTLSSDSERLRALAVSRAAVPEHVRTSAEVQALLHKHAGEASLFSDEPLDLVRKH